MRLTVYERVRMSRAVVVLIFAVVFNALANILIKVGMIRVGKTEGWSLMLRKAIAQPAILSGVVSFVLALTVLSCLGST